MGKANIVTAQDIECIKTYAECNMDVSKTARAIFRSRNGAMHHLEKVHRITGLNPLVFYDLVKLLVLFAGEKTDCVTNAERIRSMTNNELAKFIFDVALEGECINWMDALEWLNRPVGDKERLDDDAIH